MTDNADENECRRVRPIDTTGAYGGPKPSDCCRPGHVDRSERRNAFHMRRPFYRDFPVVLLRNNVKRNTTVVCPTEITFRPTDIFLGFVARRFYEIAVLP